MLLRKFELYHKSIEFCTTSMYVRITVLCRIEWLNFFRKTNYLDLFSKGCKYLNLRDACMSGSLNLKDLPNQSVDTKAMAKKPCRPLVFCGYIIYYQRSQKKITRYIFSCCQPYLSRAPKRNALQHLSQ